MPRVSVVIPAYNAGSYLKPAVQSVLSHNVQGVEVIVVDDGSTDSSLQSIECLPVKIIRKVNGGDASARNAGVLASQSEFITFIVGPSQFKHETYEAIRRVNTRYGISPKEIKPWKADYL